MWLWGGIFVFWGFFPRKDLKQGEVKQCARGHTETGTCYRVRNLLQSQEPSATLQVLGMCLNKIQF